MTHLSLPKQIILFFVIILFSVLIVFITKLGIADFNADPSYRTLKAWQLSPFEMSNNEWDEIQKQLERARELDPDNPELLMATGLAHEGRFAHAAVSLPEAKEDREEALVYYRQSVKLRPTWPYGWIDLALVKYRLGELDQEFYHAIAVSQELGPWEPGVQKIIIEIGLHGWNEINDEMQTRVLDTIKQAVIHSDKKHVNRILGLLKEYRIFYYACLSVGEDVYLKRVCKIKS